MIKTNRKIVIRVLGIALVGLLGCGKAGPRTYSVRGKVAHATGQVQHLAGNHVEAALVSNPNVRASGEIQPDGAFSLETTQAGTLQQGAPEGTYKIRIVLADEDKAALRVARAALGRRFLRFETSGLSIQVPPPGDITLAVSRQ